MSATADRPLVSVVVAARDAERTLGECLGALARQSLARNDYEVVVVVDERSADGTAAVASESAAVVLDAESGPAGARNRGIEAARGRWVAFTDADCIPSRGWLRGLLDAVVDDEDALGAAGLTIGYQSTTAAARFVDLTGGLQAERHLAHERYPWAPTSNALYRRAALLAVGGFDARFVSYEGCDLHTRLVRQVGGRFGYAPRALVHHRHRVGWRAYWRQQVSYGRGYAQFFRRYRDELSWGMADEAHAWGAVVLAGLRALLPGRGDPHLLRRGSFVKALAQRVGFLRTYWSRSETARWRGLADGTTQPTP